MNTPDINEFRIKERRLRLFMETHGYGAIVMGTQANFSWISGGGSSRVIASTDLGEAVIVVTETKNICIANTMDAPRIMEQELGGLDFELVSLKWRETPRDAYAAGLIKGLRALSDFPLAGAECNFKKFYRLHYPLTGQEIARYRVLGREAEEVLFDVSGMIKPGMTGSDVETLLICEFARRKISAPVAIIGVDEEISSWRHPIPWGKPIKDSLMLVLGVSRHGLNVPITRMVRFGCVPDDMRHKFDVVCTIAADTILGCREGVRFADISARQRALYERYGYADEWERHFVGGLTGYVVSDGSLCMDRDAAMTNAMAFNWYTTITGVNTEDTMLTARDGRGYELLTVNGIWPVKRFEADNGAVELPDILTID
jgi:antitoxin VapB